MEENRELWEQLRREYIHSQLSYRELAEKYGLPWGQVARTGAREGWMEKRRQAAQPTESPAQRFQSLISRTMDLMEEILEDEQQFNRHLVKPRSDAASDQEERIYRKVDTKALKEFVAGLKELRTMLPGEDAGENALRVIFEAGEEAFNE